MPGYTKEITSKILATGDLPAHPIIRFNTWCKLKEAQGHPIHPAQLERLSTLAATIERPSLGEPSRWMHLWAAACRFVGLPAPLAEVGGHMPRALPPNPNLSREPKDVIQDRNSLARRLTAIQPDGDDAA